MVKSAKKLKAIVVLFLLWGRPTFASDFEFVMDCGTSTAYFGQKFICQFILYSSEDFIDVEVVKFPEFRGFWSENLSLRQGPMGLLAIPSPRGVRKQAIIGSYAIHRMLDKKTSEIIPMKITVKNRSFSRSSHFEPNEALTLLSQTVPFKLLPLPPIPNNLKSLPFTGAVGDFTTSQIEISVTYRLEEPFQLKVSLQGRGNFPEINTLPILLPDKTEILSQKSFTQGVGETMTKTFDYSLVFKTPPPKSQPLGTFLFFDPSKRSYRTLPLPNVQFTLAPLFEREEVITFHLPEPEQQWTSSNSLINNVFFWMAQLLLGISFLSLKIKDWINTVSKKKKSSPEYQREQKWNQAITAHESGETEKFIRLATAIFTDFLKEKGQPLTLRAYNYPTKKQVLSAAQAKLSNQQLKHIETLFQQYDRLYSTSKTVSENESLVKDLSNSLKATQLPK